MNNALLIFIGVFTAFAGSWYGMVLQPHRQLAGQQEVVLASGRRYPAPRGGLAERGAEVYRQEGCYYCHSQQVRASRYEFNIHLLSLPKVEPPTPESVKLTNEMVKVLIWLNPDAGKNNGKGARDALRRPPRMLVRHASEEKVKEAKKRFADAGAPEESLGIELLAVGPDTQRGWGERRSVAQDYLHDDFVMLGSVRHGPDLKEIAERKPDAVWHLHHLFKPGVMVSDSRMPSYPHLFELRPIGPGGPSPGALRGLVGEFAPPKGFEWVPKPEARALVAYLLSQRVNGSLFEARMPSVAPEDAETREE